MQMKGIAFEVNDEENAFAMFPSMHKCIQTKAPAFGFIFRQPYGIPVI